MTHHFPHSAARSGFVGEARAPWYRQISRDSWGMIATVGLFSLFLLWWWGR